MIFGIKASETAIDQSNQLIPNRKPNKPLHCNLASVKGNKHTSAITTSPPRAVAVRGRDSSVKCMRGRRATELNPDNVRTIFIDGEHVNLRALGVAGGGILNFWSKGEILSHRF